MEETECCVRPDYNRRPGRSACRGDGASVHATGGQAVIIGPNATRTADTVAGFRTKRIHDPAGPGDGRRVLVDRLWPRGLKKADAAIDEWLHEVAPSAELRRWFGHDPARWEEFVRRYHAELDARPETAQPLIEAARRQTVTLCFGARDRERNNAVALKSWLEGRR